MAKTKFSPIYIRNLAKQLEIDEGLRETVYLDSKGIPTTGIGFNLEDPQVLKDIRSNNAEVAAALENILKSKSRQIRIIKSMKDGPDKARLIKKFNGELEKLGPIVPKDTSRKLLPTFIDRAHEDARRVIPRFTEMPEEAQSVLTNMAFNLGATKLNKFNRLKRNAEKLDYAGIAAEMQDSAWHPQVGSRAVRLVKRMQGVAANPKPTRVSPPSKQKARVVSDQRINSLRSAYKANSIPTPEFIAKLRSAFAANGFIKEQKDPELKISIEDGSGSTDVNDTE